MFENLRSVLYMNLSLLSRSSVVWAALGVGVLLASAAPAPAAAQGSGNGFLFRAPAASLAIRGGFNHASASSELFSFSTEHLTLDRGDFSGPSVGADLSIRLTPRIALGLGAAYTGVNARSEMRDWVDEDDRPIEQTTQFQRVPVTADVRAYLTPRGRSVGRFAWVPARYAPYVGVGGGAMWYRFRQQGEFVDFKTLDIFGDELESSGWTPMAQALAGIDISLSPRFVLTGETRYSWAKAELSSSFQDFDRLDLSGLSTSIGISIRH